MHVFGNPRTALDSTTERQSLCKNHRVDLPSASARRRGQLHAVEQAGEVGRTRTRRHLNATLQARLPFLLFATTENVHAPRRA
jgi:hypothetical protein